MGHNLIHAAAALAFLATIATTLEPIDCSTRKGPTSSMEVTNPYDEIVSIRTCNDIDGCIGVGSQSRYGDCDFQVIQPNTTVVLVFDAFDANSPPTGPVRDALQYLVFDSDADTGMCPQNNQTYQQALSRDEFWGKAGGIVDNVTWPLRHTVDFPQRTCHFCDSATPAAGFAMEVVNPYTHNTTTTETWVKVRACRHAKCAGDSWQVAHYDDCEDKIDSEMRSAKVFLDDAVQYVVFSCTGLENNGIEVLYKPLSGKWPPSVSVDCTAPLK